METFPIWRIRSASAADADALALVGAATFLETFAGMVDGGALVAHCVRAHSADAYRAYLDKGAKAWLAEIEPGHAPVGYALTGEPELEQAGPCDLELKRIYMLARYQGSPIASSLMRTACESAAGHERLLLGVKDDNHRAIAFYRKHGFEIIGTRRFDVGGKVYDDLVLALQLAAAPAL
jgi:Acetyltransferases